MTRIIGGTAGGRRLATPKGDQTRPTSDRVREALFSALDSWAGSLHGLRFLDLYAGSGAIGLEAWSRGAAAVTLVESDRRTAALVASNARSLGFPEADVVAASVPTVLAGAPRSPYDVVFSDPPYPLDEEALARDLALLASNGWLAPDALVVVERASRSPEPTWPAGLRLWREKKYGETRLWYAEAAPDR
ncbi:16S rRNA (guanine(966)-N(2))-methyltransferase RsmD [Nocardioides sp. CER19]|uniref:16S rRNA (guanine(966)-N(2))-methyltransferase RsmD n=1 Tax=Nocardioides sp. CER19 TaxID=3038538 RepID=UPI0024496A7B|nr:16S rRNA (guanine(966)-N(2))-methyltransferase RsmD [Nocardioides sp. CER19]MDH2416945.1 16S rRNA (guanine(966)-N(2))-methyltransferase RsmD [Nocardioides sp. CER19]